MSTNIDTVAVTTLVREVKGLRTLSQASNHGGCRRCRRCHRCRRCGTVRRPW